MRVAYATAGRGPALLVPAAWLSHLELAWQDPAVRRRHAPPAAHRTVVRYDKPGCGLSDPWPGHQRSEDCGEGCASLGPHGIRGPEQPRREPRQHHLQGVQRARGKGHHAALRALGNRWLEILWHCLLRGVLYDEATS